jgi:hypothetical protein
MEELQGVPWRGRLILIEIAGQTSLVTGSLILENGQRVIFVRCLEMHHSLSSFRLFFCLFANLMESQSHCLLPIITQNHQLTAKRALYCLFYVILKEQCHKCGMFLNSLF